MTGQTELAALQRVPFFKDLPAGALHEVYHAASAQTFQAGSFIFHQDDPAEHLYVVTEGRVKLYQLSLEGQQVIMRVATAWMLIAVISLVPGAVYPVTAEVAEDSRLLSWSQASMLGLLERHPQLAVSALRMISEQVREFQDRYRELATERVERRLARTILRLASQTGRKTPEGVLLDLPLTRQDLAEMSGTTLYTVSRILSSWEDQGLVQSGRERVLIRFPHGLVTIAEDLPVRGAPGSQP